MIVRTAHVPIRFLRSLGLFDCLLVFLFSLLTLFTATAILLSLKWEGYWDHLYFHHIAYLIFSKGMAPYKEVFDVNMFGIYIFHGMVGGLFGYGDLALRLVDITWLIATATVTFFLMRKIDWRAAWLSSALFSWVYITQGEMQVLQREYLMILPTACSIFIASSPIIFDRNSWLRSLVIGILFGIATSFKPNGIVGFPVVILFESQYRLSAEYRILDKRRIAPFARGLFWGILGLILPLGIGMVWLWSRGSLQAFHEIITIYWPVYSKVMPMETYRCVSDAERAKIQVSRLISFHNLYEKQWLILPALFAASLKLRRPFLSGTNKMLVGLLLTLFVLNGLQVVLVGHYHPYSWMPMIYFLVLLFSLCFSVSQQETPDLLHGTLILAAVLAAICSCARISHTLHMQLAGKPALTTWTKRSKEIADFLKLHMRPEDEVQVFDFLGGTSRALLQSQASLPTPVFNDAYLSLMVKNPYVAQMRRNFLDKLKTKRPRYIVVVADNRLYSFDPDEDGSFYSEVNAFIANQYKLAIDGTGYQIWEVTPLDKDRGASNRTMP